MSPLSQWENALVAKTLARVVESIAAEQICTRRVDRGKRILVASYAEDFEYLWCSQNDLMEWFAAGDQHVILVWDGSPPTGQLVRYNAAEYLTPVDWAVQITLMARYLPRITIIDFASHFHANARSLKTFRNLHRLNPSPLPHVQWLKLPDLREFLSTLESQAPMTQPTQQDRAMLRGLWSSLLGDGESHHAVSNIVGPLLLLESMQRPKPKEGSVIAAALRQYSSALLEKDLQRDGNTNAPWFEYKSNLSGLVDSIILIDDLAEDGWGDVLRAMLGIGMSDSRVRTYVRPNGRSSGLDLAKYIRNRLDWLRSGRHSAPPSLAPDIRNPLVFLDIRLFSPSELGEERTFYQTLLGLAREFANLSTKAWPIDLSDKTLDAVSRFTSGEAELESADHHAALSLLPRLLALADPTLPIVLFSSTGRRRIVEALIPCGNVIFDFEKPRLAGGDWSEAVDRARLGFERAMERVIPLLRTRSFLQDLCEDASRQKRNVQNTSRTTFPFAEVYLDESGDDGLETPSPVLSVGGIIVLYPDAKVRDRLDLVLKENGLVWGLAESHPPIDVNDILPEHHIPKYPGIRRRRTPGIYRWTPGAYAEFLERLHDCFADLNIQLAAFALVSRPCEVQSRDTLPEPLREDVIDNRYRRMIEEVLEAVLYCVLPTFLSTDAQISVDCGTRQRPPRPPYDVRTLRADFGIGTSRWTGKYYVVSSDSVYPIVGRLLASRPGPPPNVRRARGTTLYDYESLKDLALEYTQRRTTKRFAAGPKEPTKYERIVSDQSRPRPRQIHYLADWFARFGMHYPSLPPATIISTAFKCGFLENRDERFAGWLRAARAGADGRLTDALSEIWLITKQKDPVWSIDRWLRGSAADWAKMLDGPSFIELSARIHAGRAQV